MSVKYTVYFLFIIFNLLFNKSKQASQKAKVQQKVNKNVYIKIQNSNFAYCRDITFCILLWWCWSAHTQCRGRTQLVKTNKQKNEAAASQLKLTIASIKWMMKGSEVRKNTLLVGINQTCAGKIFSGLLLSQGLFFLISPIN